MQRGSGTLTAALNTTPSLPKPRITGAGVGITTGLWVLYTVLLSAVITQAEGAPFVGVLIGQSLESLIMALASLPIWWLVVREMDTMHWGGSWRPTSSSLRSTRGARWRRSSVPPGWARPRAPPKPW